MRRFSTATRASSPIRPGRTAFANRPTENAEKTSMKLGWGWFERLHDHGAPGKRTHEHREQVQSDRGGNPAPLDRGERVGDSAPRRPVPPERREHADGAEQDERSAHPAAAQEAHDAATACS